METGFLPDARNKARPPSTRYTCTCLCVRTWWAAPHLQSFQLLLEVVLIHELDLAELLLFLNVLLPHHLHLPKDLRGPVAGSPPVQDGEWEETVQLQLGMEGVCVVSGQAGGWGMERIQTAAG